MKMKSIFFGDAIYITKKTFEQWLLTGETTESLEDVVQRSSASKL